MCGARDFSRAASVFFRLAAIFLGLISGSRAHRIRYLTMAGGSAMSRGFGFFSGSSIGDHPALWKFAAGPVVPRTEPAVRLKAWMWTGQKFTPGHMLFTLDQSRGAIGDVQRRGGLLPMDPRFGDAFDDRQRRRLTHNDSPCRGIGRIGMVFGLSRAVRGGGVSRIHRVVR